MTSVVMWPPSSLVLGFRREPAARPPFAIGAITDRRSVKARGERLGSPPQPVCGFFPMRETRRCASLNTMEGSDAMAQIFWLIVPYAFICGVLGAVAYVMVEIFGDGRGHQHRFARGTR
jgi:hypothetical protein